MNKIKILYYTELWANAGIESVIMNLYRNLNLDRYSVDIMASQNLSNFYDIEIESLGGHKYISLSDTIKSPFKRMLINFGLFGKYIRTNKYDIVHLHMCNAAAMIYGYIAKKNGVKVVVYHSHNTNLSSNNRYIKTLLHKLCKIIFEKYGDLYLSCSDLASLWMYRRKTIDRNCVSLLKNGINLSRFRYNESYRLAYRLKIKAEGKIVLGHIGRFAFAKNHSFLIDIFSEFHRIEQNSMLLLIGEGEDMENMRFKVNRLGLCDSVIFYGTTSEIPQLLSAMDAFILPSLFEGNPVVGIEAQASSLPCFFADTITPMCKLTNHVHYLSLKSTANQWAQCIYNFLKNYHRGDSSIYIKKEGYDIQDVVMNLMSKYETELRKKDSASRS